MSLSQPFDDLQYSFNSLYTPSYSIAGLLPLASPEDFAPLSSTSRKSSEHASPQSPKSLKQAPSPRLGEQTELSISQEAKQAESGPHYQKLKMNYFRRLNVVPKSSEVSDVTQKTSPTTKKQTEKSLKSSSTSNSKFIPTFTPSPSRSSLPIKIPSSSKSRQRFKETDRDGKQKTPQMAFSVKRQDSLDHFGVFDTEFEM